MGPEAIERAAEFLAGARLNHTAVGELPADCRPTTEAEGYAVQRALHRRRTAAVGVELSGYKVGATTQVMQELLDIPHPASGGVLSPDIYQESVELPRDHFQRLGIECEIAVRLGADLTPDMAPFDRDGIAARVDTCMASMEIVDDRYGGFQNVGVPTLIADDFFHAACVLGPPVENWQGLDLPMIAGRTLIDGVEAGHGVGADVMGHPLDAVIWLADRMAANGESLRAGHFITTGSIVAVQWLGDPPVEATVIVEGLGEISTRFA